VLKYRSEALNQKLQTERKILDKMRRSNKYSPKTYKHKKKALIRWVEAEKKDIKKAKYDFEEDCKKTMEMFEQANHNKAKIKKMLNQAWERKECWSEIDSLKSNNSSSFALDHNISLDSSRQIYGAGIPKSALNHSHQENSIELNPVMSVQTPKPEMVVADFLPEGL